MKRKNRPPVRGPSPAPTEAALALAALLERGEVEIEFVSEADEATVN